MADFVPFTTPIRLLFLGLYGLFLVAGVVSTRDQPGGLIGSLQAAGGHFLVLWLPLLFSLLFLYLITALLLPGHPGEDRSLVAILTTSQPHWLIMILFFIALFELYHLAQGLKLIIPLFGHPAAFAQIKSLALMVTGLCGVYILIWSPHGLLLTLPLVYWFFIAGRNKFIDWLLFIAGGLAFYGMVVWLAATAQVDILRIIWAIWLSIATLTVDFLTAVVILTIVAAGLSMVAPPPEAAGRP